jgi:hypothetical protein
MPLTPKGRCPHCKPTKGEQMLHDYYGAELAVVENKLSAVPVEAIVVLGTPLGANDTRACLLALDELSAYVVAAGLQDMNLSNYVQQRLDAHP